MKKHLNKIISVVLSISIVASVLAVCSMTSAYATQDNTVAGASDTLLNDGNVDGTDDYYPLVIVPGINHSPVYWYDENNDPVLDSNGNAISGTLLMIDSSNIVEIAIKTLLLPMVKMLLFQKDCGFSSAAAKFADQLLSIQKTNSDGSTVNNLQVKHYNYPLSQFDENATDGEYDRDWFYRMLPLQSYTKVAGEDKVYLYTFNLVGDVMDAAKGLDEFIQQVKEQTGYDKVNLLNVSLGGTVFTAYMDNYVEKNDIHDIVNVVAALDGTNIIGDFYKRDWNLSDEDVYMNYIPYVMAEDGNEAMGYLINIALRIMPKSVLYSTLTSVYDVLFENLLHNASQLWALIPSSYYPELAERYLTGSEHAKVRKSTDAFYHAQLNLKNNIKKAIAQGSHVNNICGYGLYSGAVEYNFFSIAGSAYDVNGDGIIPIESTSMGATSVKAGSKFADDYTQAVIPEGSIDGYSYISPERSVDASTCVLPDNTWFFGGQHHEAGKDDVVLKLAATLFFNDEMNVHTDPENWPQFNGTRNTKALTRSWFEIAENFDTSTVSQEDAQNLKTTYDNCKTMMERTNIDTQGDAAIIEQFRKALVKVGAISDSTKSEKDVALELFAHGASNAIFKFVGGRGFSDVVTGES